MGEVSPTQTKTCFIEPNFRSLKLILTENLEISLILDNFTRFRHKIDIELLDSYSTSKLNPVEIDFEPSSEPAEPAPSASGCTAAHHPFKLSLSKLI